MPPLPPPKALLFDIGGVVSPFQAILDYELAHAIPPGWVNFSIQRAAPTGAWQRLERGEAVLDATFFAAFKSELENPALWDEFWLQQSKLGKVHGAKPPTPSIAARDMFWEMMRVSRRPDPWMYPALKALRALGKFVMGALSNTIPFHEGVHAGDSTAIRDRFDVFISSAHVGLRKPDARIYELALSELDRESRRRGLGPVGMGDVLFLDDIGSNLKGARACGMRTLRVVLGETERAVRELEGLTGVRLVEERAKL
ncbi:putative epoxide hydrolase [Mytilinidion resinicola]|uniref:Epoxide hydrolase n=1 Tax=Mytilinidion resinicola TaxID=574789 RepID=A0A6A6ZAF7_9PEZI|nr:putative epoxide hydrolase [Mytilinidion resinicola]KAF2817679.1 putative epoxide hydrolase [Mytilinidion resinicola]